MKNRDEDEFETIFRRWITTRDGRRLDARKYGRQAWAIRVRRRR